MMFGKFFKTDDNVGKERVFLSGGTYFFAIFSKFTHCQIKRRRVGREVLAKGEGNFSVLNQVSAFNLSYCI